MSVTLQGRACVFSPAPPPYHPRHGDARERHQDSTGSAGSDAAWLLGRLAPHQLPGAVTGGADANYSAGGNYLLPWSVLQGSSALCQVVSKPLVYLSPSLNVLSLTQLLNLLYPCIFH